MIQELPVELVIALYMRPNISHQLMAMINEDTYDYIQVGKYKLRRVITSSN